MKQILYDRVVKHIIDNQEKFYRLAFSYVHNQEDALDVVQNAIYKALEHYYELRNESAINTWFYRILVNESLLFLRQKKEEVFQKESEVEEIAYYEKEYDKEEDLYEPVNHLEEELQKRNLMPKSAAGVAAAILVAFTAFLNTSTTFAQNVSAMPIIGAVAKVLTFRSYVEEKEDLKLSVKIPSVEMISQDTNGLAESIRRFTGYFSSMPAKQCKEQKNIKMHLWIPEEPRRSGELIILKSMYGTKSTLKPRIIYLLQLWELKVGMLPITKENIITLI